MKKSAIHHHGKWTGDNELSDYDSSYAGSLATRYDDFRQPKIKRQTKRVASILLGHEKKKKDGGEVDICLDETPIYQLLYIHRSRDFFYLVKDPGSVFQWVGSGSTG